MRRIGFSTGALAKGDFREGIRLQQELANAVELSALREDEFGPLLDALEHLELSSFRYVSFHAPSQLVRWTEKELVGQLLKIPHWIQSVVVHPNIINDYSLWRQLADRLLIENMDQRYPVGRSVEELEIYFEQLPEAKFCFDIGHSRQIDPTMGIASRLLNRFRDHLAEVHISEVDAASQHCPISSAACQAFQRILPQIDQSVPVIVESVVEQSQIEDELQMARQSFCEIHHASAT